MLVYLDSKVVEFALDHDQLLWVLGLLKGVKGSKNAVEFSLADCQLVKNTWHFILNGVYEFRLVGV